MPSYDLSTQESRNMLPPRRKPYWHFVRANNHVGLNVLKSGQRWVARYRNHGNEYTTITLGTVGVDGNGINFSEALRLAEFEIERMKKQKKVKSPIQVIYNGELIVCPFGKVYSVSHACRDFMEWKRIAGTPATFAATLSQVNYHIIPRFGNLPVSEFNGKHFYDFCLDVLETPAKYGNSIQQPKIKLQDIDEDSLRKRKKTLNTLVSSLRVAFTLAWERGDIETDMPIRCLRRLPNYDRPRATFLTRKECRRLLECSSPSMRNLVAGALYTGCRVRELTNLRVGEIAKHGFGLFVAKSKSYRARFVYLPDEGMAFFLDLIRGKNDGDLVFTDHNGEYWKLHYSYHFRNAVEKAKLPLDTVFHTLRHTYASQLIQAGTSMGAVAKQLGHANTNSVDQTYGHLVPGIAGFEIQRYFSKLDDKQKPTQEIQKKVAKIKKQMEKLPPPRDEEFGSWPLVNRSLHQTDILYELSPSTRRFRAT